MTTANTNITGSGLDASGKPAGVDPAAVTISGIVLDESYGPDNLTTSLKNFDRDIAEGIEDMRGLVKPADDDSFAAEHIQFCIDAIRAERERLGV